MQKRKHVFWETLLLIGSIFAFRGLWMLLDRVSGFNENSFLIVSFLLGVIVMGFAYYKMAHAH
ncbi:MAG: hypothetical protein AABW79_03605 [Nanoarchaeota archaeon]